jgi:hypothetical protein
MQHKGDHHDGSEGWTLSTANANSESELQGNSNLISVLATQQTSNNRSVYHTPHQLLLSNLTAACWYAEVSPVANRNQLSISAHITG